MPERIQMSRQHPWRKDNPDAVIVARPSKWANPYTVQMIMADHRGAGAKISAEEARTKAVAFFRRDLTSEEPPDYAERIIEDLHELRGCDLACWCPLGGACHGNVLLRFANQGDGRDQQ